MLILAEAESKYRSFNACPEISKPLGSMPKSGSRAARYIKETENWRELVSHSQIPQCHQILEGEGNPAILNDRLLQSWLPRHTLARFLVNYYLISFYFCFCYKYLASVVTISSTPLPLIYLSLPHPLRQASVPIRRLQKQKRTGVAQAHKRTQTFIFHLRQTLDP